MSLSVPRFTMLSVVAVAAIVGCSEKPVNRVDIQDAVQLANPDQVQPQSRGEIRVGTAILGGGCFWCVESDFQKLPGVVDVVSGYSGGTTDNPTYKNYAAGNHVEVVKVSYDPAQVTYAGLVEWLIKHSDPTDGSGSFADRGPQYRPVVYYETEAEKRAAEKVIQTVDQMNVYSEKLALEVVEQQKFWPAEDYHQDYAKNSLVKYDYYRLQSGRDAFIEKHWGDRAKKLELPISVPSVEPADRAESNGIDKVDVAKNLWENFQKPSQTELRKTLTDIQYEVTQENGTEVAFQNKFWDNHDAGIYVDIVSGEPLFSSSDKFESGTGWPSFVRPLDKSFIELRNDDTLIAMRTEVRSKIADSHVGHVFNDGPAERGGQRWCMNSAALKFIAKDQMEVAGYGDYASLVEATRE